MLYLLINVVSIIIRLTNQDSTLNCPIKNGNSESFMLVEDFNRFDQLNFTLCVDPIPIKLLEIRPAKKIILDKSFNLTGLVVKPAAQFLTLLFSDLDGIDLEENPMNGLEFSDFSLDYDQVFIIVEKSTFNFFSNGKLLDRSYCDLNKFPRIEKTFMNSINSLILSVSYPSEILCPLLFQNVDIKLLSIPDLSTSPLKRKIFSFLNLSNRTIDFQLNSNIFQFILNVFHIDLKEDILSPLVFGRLNCLDINGQLDSIQDDLFKSFKQLKMLRFRTQNVKGLFVRRNEWLKYLNYEVSVDLDNPFDMEINRRKTLFLVVFQTFSNIVYYEYPDKDFCYFKNFPHKRLVLPHLKPISKSKCTCTELFLIQNTIKYAKEINLYANELIDDYSLLSKFYFDDIYEKNISICSESDIERLLQNCDFDRMLNNCNISTSNYKLA